MLPIHLNGHDKLVVRAKGKKTETFRFTETLPKHFGAVADGTERNRRRKNSERSPETDKPPSRIRKAVRLFFG